VRLLSAEKPRGRRPSFPSRPEKPDRTEQDGPYVLFSRMQSGLLQTNWTRGKHRLGKCPVSQGLARSRRADEFFRTYSGPCVERKTRRKGAMGTSTFHWGGKRVTREFTSLPTFEERRKPQPMAIRAAVRGNCGCYGARGPQHVEGRSQHSDIIQFRVISGLGSEGGMGGGGYILKQLCSMTTGVLNSYFESVFLLKCVKFSELRNAVREMGNAPGCSIIAGHWDYEEVFVERLSPNLRNLRGKRAKVRAIEARTWTSPFSQRSNLKVDYHVAG